MTGVVQNRVKDRSLPLPDANALGQAMVSLAEQIHLDQTERAIVASFLDTLEELLPKRVLGIRIGNPRATRDLRGYVRGGSYRQHAEEQLSLTEQEVVRAQLRPAIPRSALVNVGPHSDPPLTPASSFFTLALAARGELYGTLDVGYPLGRDMSSWDRTLLEPFANLLATALANHWQSQSLRRLHARHERMLSALNCTWIAVGHDFRITGANHAAAAAAGLEIGELIGTDLRSLLGQGQRGEVTSKIASAIRDVGHETSISFVFRNSEEMIRWLVICDHTSPMGPTCSLYGLRS